MSEICRKDSLTRNMSRMLKMFPKEYAFYPKAWCLPAEYVSRSNRPMGDPLFDFQLQRFRQVLLGEEIQNLYIQARCRLSRARHLHHEESRQRYQTVSDRLESRKVASGVLCLEATISSFKSM